MDIMSPIFSPVSMVDEKREPNLQELILSANEKLDNILQLLHGEFEGDLEDQTYANSYLSSHSSDLTSDQHRIRCQPSVQPSFQIESAEENNRAGLLEDKLFEILHDMNDFDPTPYLIQKDSDGNLYYNIEISRKWYEYALKAGLPITAVAGVTLAGAYHMKGKNQSKIEIPKPSIIRTILNWLLGDCFISKTQTTPKDNRRLPYSSGTLNQRMIPKIIGGVFNSFVRNQATSQNNNLVPNITNNGISEGVSKNYSIVGALAGSMKNFVKSIIP